jgi:hypothetical protein
MSPSRFALKIYVKHKSNSQIRPHLLVWTTIDSDVNGYLKRFFLFRKYIVECTSVATQRPPHKPLQNVVRQWLSSDHSNSYNRSDHSNSYNRSNCSAEEEPCFLRGTYRDAINSFSLSTLVISEKLIVELLNRISIVKYWCENVLNLSL